MKNLFTYGTLMCGDIMKEVSGVCLKGQTAVLRGYTRRSVKGEHYPGLVVEEKGSVEGIVYLDLPDNTWRRLDRFEGDMYRRCPVLIKSGEGAHLQAETYVVKFAFLHHLEASEWDFDSFLERGKVDFQQRYRGYRNL